MIIQLPSYGSMIGDLMAQNFLNSFNKMYDTITKENLLQNALNFTYPSMYEDTPTPSMGPISKQLTPSTPQQPTSTIPSPKPVSNNQQTADKTNQLSIGALVKQALNPQTTLTSQPSSTRKLKDFNTWLNEFVNANRKQLSTLMALGYNPSMFLVPAIQSYELAYRTNFAKQQQKEKENLNLQNLKRKYEAAVRVIPTMAKKFGVNLDPYTTAYAALGIASGAFKMNDLINTFKNHYIFQPRTSEDGTIYYVSEDPQTGTIKNVYSFKPNLTQLTQITSAKAFSDQHARDEAKRRDGVGSGGGAKGSKSRWELRITTDYFGNTKAYLFNPYTGEIKPATLPDQSNQDNQNNSSNKKCPKNDLLCLMGKLKGNN